MSDFFDKIQAMDSTDKIFEEIKKLNERLFRINEGSPMHEQLQGMIDGEEWDEEGDDLKNKYPKLWAKFGMK